VNDVLRQITIQNFAIIDDLSIEFPGGFSVITGETGAGKSIIIEALGLIVGDRSNASMVRHGTDRAVVEGVFNLNEQQLANLDSISSISEPIIVVGREIDKEGRSTVRLNGRITTLGTIRSIMREVIDIHSQHDNNVLLDRKNHLDLLDRYGFDSIQPIRNQYINIYNQYNEIIQEISKLKSAELDQDRLDLLRFQIKELEEANIREHELEELEEEHKRILMYEKISQKMEVIKDSLEGDYGTKTSLFTAKKALESLSEDSKFTELSSQLSDLYYGLEDFLDSIHSIFEGINFDSERMSVIQDRIYEINRLRRKYGSTYEDIQETLGSIKSQVERSNLFEATMEEYRKKKDRLFASLIEKGKELSNVRKLANKQLSKEIECELSDLHLKKSTFVAHFLEKSEPDSSGIDDVEFFVSLNPGQPPRPLIKVASGGEVSRLMLGLKVVLSRLLGISTIIFDEIDTGLSGTTAYSVGEKMKKMSLSCQVISITHLTQVACQGNNHYRVGKLVREGKTYTEVVLLKEQERIREIASMLSTNSKPTEINIKMAKELLKVE
jgi:DNA repair protein RecN (Recombination protein N)